VILLTSHAKKIGSCIYLLVKAVVAKIVIQLVGQKFGDSPFGANINIKIFYCPRAEEKQF
jgi:hypothetical protein